MSSFASFRKCDFQIHSPRDPGWRGSRPVGLKEKLPNSKIATPPEVDVARRLWANEFIEACVKKQLHAVAITDHHETVMVKYVIAEIETRIENGNDPDLWVFPAMELTLQDGVQSLILFDADLPEENWSRAQAVLGIDNSNTDILAATAPAPKQLPHTYNAIATQLDTIESLRGRYIVLPNVSDGGHSVVRQGWHKRFCEMPYVGGYMDADQNISTCNASLRRRLSGTDVNWGDRFIYPLPTSDSRDAGFPKLGKNDTWIKLSAPKAESIRQAFLAHQSRITIAPPQYPSVVITTLTVHGTDPLSDSIFYFSPELNCFIGGRGSGKSTVLEYAAFGLGRSCYDLPERTYSGTARLKALIADTVIAKNATIELIVSQDGAAFKIVRSPATGYQPQITYPNGKTEALSPTELRAVVPAYVYSQGELSELGSADEGTKLADLLGFVDASFKVQADSLEKKIIAGKEALSSAARKLVQLWEAKATKSSVENRANALKARITALRSTLPKLGESDQAVLDTHAELLEGSEEISRALEDTENIQANIEELTLTISAAKKIEIDIDQSDYKTARNAFENIRKHSGEEIRKLVAKLRIDETALNAAARKWEAYVAAHQKKRDAIIEKIGAQKVVARQVAELQATAATETAKLQNLDRQISSLGNPTEVFRKSREQLKGLVAQQVTAVKEWTKKIEDLSDSCVEVELRDDGDLSEIFEALDIVAQRTRSQEAVRTRKFLELSKKDGAWKSLDRISSELLNLLQWKIEGGEDPKRIPPVDSILGILAEGDSVKKALIEQLDTKRVVSLLEATPRISVALKYKSDGRTIPFEKASEGQRATVLLMMLLKQGGGPLIIDQPEGDLDNSVITKVVDLLHNIKHMRQLIFASHNANLVVNGSAEMVAIMNNDDTGRRVVEASGAIDQPEVRIAITGNMEGGKEAFKDRQRKYGF